MKRGAVAKCKLATAPFFMAPLARLERTTFRLGGGPSILVRYRGLTVRLIVPFSPGLVKKIRSCAMLQKGVECCYLQKSEATA